jgi:tetratricopeptide (TPR) repeat protein
MSMQISLATVLAALLVTTPALADAPADCRNPEAVPETRLAACLAALDGVEDPALRAEFMDHQARALRTLGRTEEAEQIAWDASDLAPEDADPLVTRANLLNDLGSYRVAQDLLDRALRLEPGNVRAIHGAMANLNRLGDTEGCLAYGEQALALAPDSPQTFVHLATCEDSAGANEDALVHYDRAIELGYDEARARNFRSILLFGLERFSEARAEAARAVQLAPEDEDARVSLMIALARAGAPQKAIALYHDTQAMGIADTLGQADNLAWALYRAGEPELALAVHKDGRVANPDTEFVIGVRGHALSALGRSEEAAQAFEADVAAYGPEMEEWYSERLEALGFSLDKRFGAAIRACTATGANCRFSD